MELSPDEQARTVISSRVFEAPADAVFDAYANPEKIVRWWGPAGFTLDNEAIDLVEGGHWRFTFSGPDGKRYPNHLAFRTVERPRLFVVEHLNPPRYRGAVTFEPEGGATRVTMYWTFETQKVYNGVRDIVAAGNEGNFDRLGEVLAGRR